MTGAPSWWWADLGGLPAPRPPCGPTARPTSASSARASPACGRPTSCGAPTPSLEVVVLEREVAGFGASGRNGGWVLGELSAGGSLRRAAGDAAIARSSARPGRRRRGRRRLRARGHRLRLRQGRHADVSPRPRRSSSACRSARGASWLESRRARPRRACASPGLRGARFTPHCARVQPAKLARGLAEAVERHGATIHEGTAASTIAPGRVRTPRATCARAGSSAPPRATRRPARPRARAAAAVELDDRHRAARRRTWAQIGWEGCETIDDAAHAYCYAAAHRRRAHRDRRPRAPLPLRLAHRPRGRDGPRPRSASCARASSASSRSLADVRLDGAWTGVLGVPRDWAAAVRCDRDTGLCWAGGYVGRGRRRGQPRRRAPCATSSSAATPSSRACRGSATARARGSPSRCAGSACRRSTARSARPTRLEDRTGRQSRLAGAAGALAGR